MFKDLLFEKAFHKFWKLSFKQNILYQYIFINDFLQVRYRCCIRMWYIITAHIYTGIIVTVVQYVNIDSYSSENCIMASSPLFHLGVATQLSRPRKTWSYRAHALDLRNAGL
jgi:hypothetical protein